jgi:hypothetical protein
VETNSFAPDDAGIRKIACAVMEILNVVNEEDMDVNGDNLKKYLGHCSGTAIMVTL